MKPRSKRNRKRPRSERQQEELECKTSIVPLELDGKPVLSSSFGDASAVSWIRMVEPYPYTFTSFAKARWVDRTVLDIYTTEFGSYPKTYYEHAIEEGRITVNDEVVPLDRLIRQHDILAHTVHRHEPAVAVASKEPPHIKIVHDSETVLAVDKPGTLPIHPCGGYHVQSLMNLLEPKYGKLYTIHRLDRLTSGLLIMGKTSAVAQEWGKAIMHRNCQKFYLARVAGKFPTNFPENLPRLKGPGNLPDHGCYTYNKPTANEGDEEEKPAKTASKKKSIDAARESNAYGYWIMRAGAAHPDDSHTISDLVESQQSVEGWLEGKEGIWLHMACPTRISKPKDGVCEAGRFDDLEESVYLKTVKPAQTSFGVIHYDEGTDSTVVLCKPATGRTHQIRLHLQHLGHSIANDPNYGGDMFYRDEKAREACSVAQDRLDAIQESNQTQGLTADGGISGPSSATIDVPATEDEIGVLAKERKGDTEKIHDFIKRTCVWCARSRNINCGTPRDALEFMVRSSGIWLHALQYSFGEEESATLGDVAVQHSFRTPLPHWAGVQNNERC